MKGGFEVIPVRDSDFKYTVSEQRIQWNKYTFPIGQYLIRAVQNIPWKTYTFDGEVHLRISKDRNNNEGITDDDYEYKSYRCTASTHTYPHYHYFGGAVYEILQTVYPVAKGFPRIRDFMDPTGDIDVLLFTPHLEVLDTKNDIDDMMLEVDADGTLKVNAFIDDYTTWVFEHFKAQLAKISPILWNHMFEDTEPFDYRKNSEGQYADRAVQFGNVWLVRTLPLDAGMVKIQMIVKYKGLESDHILELVMPLRNGDDVLKDLTHRHMDDMDLLPGEFPISSFKELIDGNVDASERRKVLWNTNIRHKLYNHVGRLQYLNQLLPAILQNPYDSTTPISIQYSKDKFLSFATSIEKLVKFLFKQKMEGTLCQFDYTYDGSGSCLNEQDILNSMGENLVSYMFRESYNSRTKRRDTVLGLNYLRMNKVHYDTYQIVGSVFPHFPLVKTSGGHRRKTYKRRQTARRTLRRRR